MDSKLKAKILKLEEIPLDFIDKFEPKINYEEFVKVNIGVIKELTEIVKNTPSRTPINKRMNQLRNEVITV